MSETNSQPSGVLFGLMMSDDRTCLGAFARVPLGLETPQQCLVRAARGVTGAKLLPPQYLLSEHGREDQAMALVAGAESLGQITSIL
jgi:hypothetical protein